MRHAVPALILLALGAALALGGRQWLLGGGGATVVSAGPTVEQVQELSELVVYRCQIADVIVGTSAGARVATLVRGDCDLAIDLSRARITDVNAEAKTATLVLPPPRVQRPRVDHGRTVVYDVDKAGWAAFNPFADDRGRLLAQVMGEAQNLIEKAAANPDYVAAAQRHATAVITAFYRAMGWKVTVAWAG